MNKEKKIQLHKNEENSLSLNVQITNNNKLKRKNSNTDETDIKGQSIKWPRLSLLSSSFDAEMAENKNRVVDEKSGEMYDVLCEYLNILMPQLHWQTNKEKEFTRYEVVNLTRKQVEIVAKQLAHLLKQAVISIGRIHEHNYRLLISGISVKYLQKMSVPLHQNRIWLPDNKSEDWQKVTRRGGMFEYPCLTAYCHALLNTGVNASSISRDIQSEWNLLDLICNQQISNAEETQSSIQQLARIILSDFKDMHDSKDLFHPYYELNQPIEYREYREYMLLQYARKGNYWLFRYYLLITDFMKSSNRKDIKYLLGDAVTGGNIEIVRDLIAFGVNWNDTWHFSDDYKGTLYKAGPLLTASLLKEENENFTIFKLLVASGADLDILGEEEGEDNDEDVHVHVLLNVLHHYDTLRFLIASSPCLSFSFTEYQGSQNYWRSPLEKCLCNQDYKAAELLISHGAMLNLFNPGFNWLKFAIEGNSLQLMQCMVKNLPIIVLQKDDEGNTPLHTAAKQGYSPKVRFLIEQAPQCLFWNNVQGEIPLDYLVDHLANMLADLKSNAYPIFQKIADLQYLSYKKESNRIQKILELTPRQIHTTVKKQNPRVITWDFLAVPYQKYADYMRSQNKNPEAIFSDIILSGEMESRYDIMLEYLRTLMPGLPWERTKLASTYKIRNLSQKESARLADHLKIAFLGYLRGSCIIVQKQSERGGFYQVKVRDLTTALLQIAARQLLQNPVFLSKDYDFMEAFLLKDISLSIVFRYLDMFDYPNEEAFKGVLLGCGVAVNQLQDYIETQWQGLEEPLPEKTENSARKTLANNLRIIEIQAEKESACYHAIKNGDFWLYKACIRKYLKIDEVNNRELPLTYAIVLFGSLDILKDAIVSGADVNGFRQLEDRNDEDKNIFYPPVTVLGFDRSDDINPLFKAVETKNDAAFKLLITTGAHVNTCGVRDLRIITLLQLIVDEGNIDWVKFVVESGAALELQNDRFKSALAISVNGSYHHIAQYLVSRGADIHKTTHGGCTLLHVLLRAKLPSVSLFIYLLDVLKLSLTEKDNDSKTPLDLLLEPDEKGQNLLHRWAGQVAENDLFAYVFIRLAYSLSYTQICIPDKKGDSVLSIFHKIKPEFNSYFTTYVLLPMIVANLQTRESNQPLMPQVSELSQSSFFQPMGPSSNRALAPPGGEYKPGSNSCCTQ